MRQTDRVALKMYLSDVCARTLCVNGPVGFNLAGLSLHILKDYLIFTNKILFGFNIVHIYIYTHMLYMWGDRERLPERDVRTHLNFYVRDLARLSATSTRPQNRYTFVCVVGKNNAATYTYRQIIIHAINNKHSNRVMLLSLLCFLHLLFFR